MKKTFLNIMSNIKEPIDYVVDIGSNVGQITKQIYNYLKPKKIYCFEPDIDNINYAKEKNKEILSIEYFNKGIYYGKKEDTVFGRGDNSAGGYYLKSCVENKKFGNFYNNSKVVNNKIFYLDELENFNIEKPDLIKLDVEGSEYNIISNSPLLKNTKYLLIEWHFPNINFNNFMKQQLPNHDIIFFIPQYLGGQYLLKSSKKIKYYNTTYYMYYDVCVIGSGPNGIYMCYELKKNNINYICFEKGEILANLKKISKYTYSEK